MASPSDPSTFYHVDSLRTFMSKRNKFFSDFVKPICDNFNCAWKTSVIDATKVIDVLDDARKAENLSRVSSGEYNAVTGLPGTGKTTCLGDKCSRVFQPEDPIYPQLAEALEFVTKQSFSAGDVRRAATLIVEHQLRYALSLSWEYSSHKWVERTPLDTLEFIGFYCDMLQLECLRSGTEFSEETADLFSTLWQMNMRNIVTNPNSLMPNHIFVIKHDSSTLRARLENRFDIYHTPSSYGKPYEVWAFGERHFSILGGNQEHMLLWIQLLSPTTKIYLLEPEKDVPPDVLMAGIEALAKLDDYPESRLLTAGALGVRVNPSSNPLVASFRGQLPVTPTNASTFIHSLFYLTGIENVDRADNWKSVKTRELIKTEPEVFTSAKYGVFCPKTVKTLKFNVERECPQCN